MTHRFALVLLALLAFTGPVAAENWPQWRGPQLNGISGETNLPIKWSKTENIAWKLPVPERSGATPIVWGDHIFLNVGEGSSLALWSVDRTTGPVRWKRPLGGGNVRMRKKHGRNSIDIRDKAVGEDERSKLARISAHELG